MWESAQRDGAESRKFISRKFPLSKQPSFAYSCGQPFVRYDWCMNEPTSKPVGPIAAMIIIVALFAVGGVYFFITQTERIKTGQAAAAAEALQQ